MKYGTITFICRHFVLQDFITGTHHYEGEWRTVYVLNRFPSDDPEVEIRHKKFADNVIKTSKVKILDLLLTLLINPKLVI